MNPTNAIHHIEGVMHWYRQVGLRDESVRVHVLLERRAKARLAEMKVRRVEAPVDREQIEKDIAQCLDVSRPLAALGRLAEYCAPTPERIRKTLTDGGFILEYRYPAHRILYRRQLSYRDGCRQDYFPPKDFDQIFPLFVIK